MLDYDAPGTTVAIARSSASVRRGGPAFTHTYPQVTMTIFSYDGPSEPPW
jgi:hypothetical protein